MIEDPKTPATEPEVAQVETEVEGAVEATTDPAENTAADTDAPGDNMDGKLAAEAAKWRVAARQAETRLADAEARIAELRTAEVKQAITDGGKLADPEDLWFTPGLTIDALLGDDGTVDPQLVSEAVDALLAAKPHWAAKVKPLGAPASAVNGDGRIPTPGQAKPSWHDLIRSTT